MLCMDNSEYSRNGDYLPTRFSAERDCINLLTSAKLNSNPKSTVGLLTLAGPRIELHVSPTREVGRIMNACAKTIEIGGESRFLSGLRTAALALKNRANKNQRQRIILFCGSPVKEDSKELVKVGKAFKKNNIAVDVINFGDEETQSANAEKWEAFIEAVTTSENSHLVIVPPGPHQLSNMIMSSPIIVDSMLSLDKQHHQLVQLVQEAIHLVLMQMPILRWQWQFACQWKKNDYDKND
jgi:26S proteasome regulatory subunit N10